jgi:hypothetical protein
VHLSVKRKTLYLSTILWPKVEVVGHTFYSVIAPLTLRPNGISIMSLDPVEDFSLDDGNEYEGQNDLISWVVLSKPEGVLQHREEDHPRLRTASDLLAPESFYTNVSSGFTCDETVSKTAAVEILISVEAFFICLN